MAAHRGEGAANVLPIPLVRITFVGAAESGKTRLIDSYVNCPPHEDFENWSVKSTKQRELYYKLTTLKADQRAAIVAFQREKKVLVELEDTPPSTLLQLREELRLHVQETDDAAVANEAERLDINRLKHPMARILDMSRAPALDIPEGIQDTTPFAVFDYPREITAMGNVDVKPLSQGRMGFALCFSLLDSSSLTEVMEIYSLLNLIKEKRQAVLTPLIFLIGTKDDLVGRPESASIAKQIRVMAEDFAGRNSLPFFKISSKNGRHVDRSLDEMVSQIVQTPSLSAFDITGWNVGEEADSSEESNRSD